MKELHMVAFVLMVVGGVNWGLVGLFNVNMVELLFGTMPILVKIVYILVGASSVYIVGNHMGDCKICAMNKKGRK